MSKKPEKTNVMRILEQNKIGYVAHTYDPAGGISGMEVATATGQNPDQVFKTLVTLAPSKKNYVFIVPVNRELNLKKAAAAANEKSIEMLKSRELLPLTGYVHGGCSPIGMKKQFATFIHESALNFDTILFSGGKIGFQVEIAPADLEKLIPLTFADITD